MPIAYQDKLTLSMSNMVNIPLKKSTTSPVSSSVCRKSGVHYITVNEDIFLHEASNRSSQNTTKPIIKACYQLNYGKAVNCIKK